MYMVVAYIWHNIIIITHNHAFVRVQHTHVLPQHLRPRCARLVSDTYDARSPLATHTRNARVHFGTRAKTDEKGVVGNARGRVRTGFVVCAFAAQMWMLNVARVGLAWAARKACKRAWLWAVSVSTDWWWLGGDSSRIYMHTRHTHTHI